MTGTRSRAKSGALAEIIEQYPGPVVVTTTRGDLHNWNYTTAGQKHLAGRRVYWPRMKALGGCSAMNAMVYAVARRDWLALYRQPRSDPPGPVGFSDAHLVLGQEPHPVSVLLFRHYQAARFADAATTGMIPSRHCPLDQLTLAPVPAIMTATTAGSSRRGKFPLAAMPVPDRLSRGAAARDVWIRLRRPS